MKHEFEEISPIELMEMPGFYKVPEHYPTAISKDGRVYSMHTKKILTTRIGVYGYILVSVNYNNTEKTYRVHRLLAKTFIGRPQALWSIPYVDLVVNHINGRKDDNRLENLEWCTNEYNSLHAISTGLNKFDEILAKDVRTGAVKRFLNAAYAARTFGLREDSLRRHVLSDRAGTFVAAWNVFKLDDNKEWPELNQKQLSENHNDFEGRGYWIATNKKDNSKVIHNTLKELCDVLQLKFVSVNHLCKKDHIDNDCFGWNIVYKDRVTSKEVDKLPPKRPMNNNGLRVILKNVVTNEIKEFNSKNSMSLATGIGLGTISYYLNTGNVLKDTYQFYTTNQFKY